MWLPTVRCRQRDPVRPPWPWRAVPAWPPPPSTRHPSTAFSTWLVLSCQLQMMDRISTTSKESAEPLINSIGIHRSHKTKSKLNNKSELWQNPTFRSLEGDSYVPGGVDYGDGFQDRQRRRLGLDNREGGRPLGEMPVLCKCVGAHFLPNQNAPECLCASAHSSSPQPAFPLDFSVGGMWASCIGKSGTRVLPMGQVTGAPNLCIQDALQDCGDVTPVEVSGRLGSFVHLLEKFCVIDSLLSLQSMLWPPER